MAEVSAVAFGDEAVAALLASDVPDVPVTSVATASEAGHDPASDYKSNQDVAVAELMLADDASLSFLCVLDGHGQQGDRVSARVKKSVLKQLRKASAEDIKGDVPTVLRDCLSAAVALLAKQKSINITLSGCTALLLVKVGGAAVVAQVGDGRALLFPRDATAPVLQLTRDHTPAAADERARIEAAGGRIDREDDAGPLRIYAADSSLPGLCVTRSLGDRVASSVGVTAEAELSAITLTGALAVIAASDGLWGSLTEQEMRETVEGVLGDGGDAESVASQLMRLALSKTAAHAARDDMSVAVLVFAE
eukprot:PLAT6498.1.p1 GENE.PLAT6498.1~~PLAT6498.1.p1  ORF type:complete len:307 (+),score=89.77 PLAT6498.1:3-923(+)